MRKKDFNGDKNIRNILKFYIIAFFTKSKTYNMKRKPMWLDSHKMQIFSALTALTGIIMISKGIWLAYIPFHNKLPELVIIGVFNTINILALTVCKMCNQVYNHFFYRILKGIEITYAVLGLVVELLVEVLTRSTSFQLSMEVISVAYLALSVAGLIILYEFLQECMNQWNDD